MIKSLYIKNLAIIDELNVEFASGLNIITGETGSGKSLLIKAIQLLLGKKITHDIIRKNTDLLEVKGVFLYNKEEIIIRRIYDGKKGSKSYINDLPVSQKKLLDQAKRLVDLHGQHDHQNLLNSKTHMNYLDLYGTYSDDIDNFSELFNKYNHTRVKLDTLIENQKNILEKEELYKFQYEEITRYPVSENYEQELMDQYKLLSNAKEIKYSLDKASKMIYDENESIIKKMIKTVNEFSNLPSTNKDIDKINSRLNSNRLDIEDILFEIQNINQNIVEDQEKLNDINEKIIYIEMLKRKYGGSIKSILDYTEFLSNNEEQIEINTTDIKKLKKLYVSLEKTLIKKAIYISKMRKTNSQKLEKAISNNLKFLNMKDTTFKINLYSSIDKISESGIDECEFFICTNLGEKLLPISDIASGGEISRIMLAIKMSMQSKDMVDTVIFDEIDTGISGATADIVGQVFENLSKSHQILCITHLSQIAGKKGSHINVYKNKNKNRVITKVKYLTEKERVSEVAKLISGLKVTETSKKQAKELLHING